MCAGAGASSVPGAGARKESVALTNTNPNTKGLGSARVQWEKSQVRDWAHARIAGRPYVAPTELPPNPQFIKKAQVLEIVGLSHVTVWKLMKKGEFPPSYRLVPSKAGQVRAE
jgi:predicted DNA-binding transcriptional regulator AlpA